MFKNSQMVIEKIRTNGLNYENEELDYKVSFKFTELREKLELIKDIVSFANTNGGIIIFGVEDENKNWVGLDDNSDDLDDNQIKNFLRKYVQQDIKFKAAQYTLDNELYYMITIEKNEQGLIPFCKDGEYERKKKGQDKMQKVHVFKKHDIYGRIGSSSCPVNLDNTFILTRNNGQIITNIEQYPRPYNQYIERKIEFNRLLDSLNNENIRNVQVNGLGGIGKTSFIRNFCDKIIKKEISLDFKLKFLIWITGKINYFTPSGSIEQIRISEITYEEMLDSFCEVFNIDIFDKNTDELAAEILQKLKNYNSLIIMDNMETINDKNILAFIKKIPMNSRLIFTTRTNMSTIYDRIDLDGFDIDQFEKYIKSVLEDYNSKNSTSYESIKPFIKDIHQLVYGSPLITNMIIYKICTGYSLNSLIRELRQTKKDSNYYDSVMSFCFNDTFEELSSLQKQILFIMSISDDKEESFQIADLKFILNYEVIDINEEISKLVTCSFCIQKDEFYACNSLVKAFSNKKMSKDKTLMIDEITSKYYLWLERKNELKRIKEDTYERARAYDIEKKELVVKIRNLIASYDDQTQYDFVISEFDKMIKNHQDYSYLYFKKAVFEKNSKLGSESEIMDCYNKAVSYDKYNDYYLSEYGFYLSEIRKNDLAIEMFEKALEINPNNSSTHHGLALALSNYYRNKDSFISKKDIIMEHFEKGYFKNNSTYAFRHNVRNAHAHAKYLYEIKEYEKALIVCKTAFEFAPNNGALKTMYSTIQKAIDPNYVSKSKTNSMRYGLLCNVDDATLRDIYNMVYKK